MKIGTVRSDAEQGKVYVFQL